MSADLTLAVRKSDRTREAVLDAARIAFARKGFSGVTIRDITDLAGVTRANFYYYFRDKTELFIGLGTETYREALATVEGLGETPNGADSSDAAVIRDWVVRSYERTAVRLGQRIAAIAASPPRADPSAVGLSIMAMLERSWSMIQHYDMPSTSRESVVEALTELIERMLR